MSRSTVRGGAKGVVTDGLVMWLDASYLRSYPGFGTIWSDLSANENNGALTNGFFYSSANGGSIQFDGSNDFVNCGNNSSVQITQGTIFAWVKTTSPGGGYRGIIVKQNAWGLFCLDGILATYDWGNALGRSTGISLTDGNWKNVAMSFTETVGSPSDNAIIYLNGISVLTTTVKHVLQTRNLLLAYGNQSPQYLAGNIASSQVYNRVLSPTEVLQNYNATKTRFGL